MQPNVDAGEGYLEKAHHLLPEIENLRGRALLAGDLAAIRC